MGMKTLTCGSKVWVLPELAGPREFIHCAAPAPAAAPASVADAGADSVDTSYLSARADDSSSSSSSSYSSTHSSSGSSSSSSGGSTIIIEILVKDIDSGDMIEPVPLLQYYRPDRVDLVGVRGTKLRVTAAEPLGVTPMSMPWRGVRVQEQVQEGGRE
jgi:hypothetical protein